MLTSVVLFSCMFCYQGKSSNALEFTLASLPSVFSTRHFQNLWVEATTNALFSPRENHEVALLNGRVYLLGGGFDVGQGNILNDVYSSADGANWVQETAAAPWLPLILFGATTHNSLLWVAGGFNQATQNYSGVFSSSDGANWNQVLAHNHGQWDGRREHRLTSFQGNLLILGGTVGGANTRRQVHTSPTGSVWTQVNNPDPASWTGARQPCVANFKNKIWLLGGLPGAAGSPSVSEVWSSTNGISWQLETTAPWPARTRHACVVYKDEIILMGGWDNESSANINYSDVWSSADGVNWSFRGNGPWGSRRGHTALVVNQQLWLIGGQDGNDNRYNDVWIGQ